MQSTTCCPIPHQKHHLRYIYASASSSGSQSYNIFPDPNPSPRVASQIIALRCPQIPVLIPTTPLAARWLPPYHLLLLSSTRETPIPHIKKVRIPRTLRKIDSFQHSLSLPIIIPLLAMILPIILQSRRVVIPYIFLSKISLRNFLSLARIFS
jgi:hypothetical protein